MTDLERIAAALERLVPLVAVVPAPLGDISHMAPDPATPFGGSIVTHVVRQRSETHETLVPKRVLGQGAEGPGMAGNARNTPFSGGNASGGAGQTRSESFRDRERVLAQRTRQAFQQQRFVRRAVGW